MKTRKEKIEYIEELLVSLRSAADHHRAEAQKLDAECVAWEQALSAFRAEEFLEGACREREAGR
jgi:hypothetical protein